MGKPAKFFKLVTPRLVIRPYTPVADAPLLKRAIDESLEHLKPWMPWAWNEPQSLEAKVDLLRGFRMAFDNGEDYTFGVFNLDETEIVAATGLHNRIAGNAREIGYWVHVNHCNKGIATEIVNALVKTCFEIEEYDGVELHCDVKNEISARVPVKCGFKLREVLIGNAPNVFGGKRDTMIWEMKQEDYAQSPAKKSAIKIFNVAGQELLLAG
jgi:RimJ/RimL family protein N-acetyltransferase